MFCYVGADVPVNAGEDYSNCNSEQDWPAGNSAYNNSSSLRQWVLRVLINTITKSGTDWETILGEDSIKKPINFCIDIAATKYATHTLLWDLNGLIDLEEADYLIEDCTRKTYIKQV